jgi:hypothetical protein
MKAFMSMREGDYESAENLLRIIIDKDENELEAGINMAILEIKKNNLLLAKKRLERLNDVHEGNEIVVSLLKKIGK